MAEVTITSQAEADLVDIAIYIAGNNVCAAHRWIDKIVEKFDIIAQMPAMGRARDELLPSLRSFPMGNYLIFYRQNDSGIEIVRILHGGRDVSSLF